MKFTFLGIILFCCLLLSSCSESKAPNSDHVLTNDTPHKVLKLNLEKVMQEGKADPQLSVVTESFMEIKSNEKELYQTLEPLIKKFNDAKTKEEVKPVVEEMMKIL